jgi:hypothetical protein
MNTLDPAWLDRMYNNRALVPGHAEHFARWAADSASARKEQPCVLDVPYGGGPNETLDVFPGAAKGAPVLVFIHGGYWRSLDKADHSFIAPAMTRLGACVVIPNYALCPAVTIPDICLQMVRALEWTWRHVAESTEGANSHTRSGCRTAPFIKSRLESRHSPGLTEGASRAHRRRYRAVNLSGTKDRGSGSPRSARQVAMLLIATHASFHAGFPVKGISMHVIVLGAGLLGVSSAYFLQQLGHDVTVIDRQASPGAETSFANGGQISVSHAEPWANPARRSRCCSGWARKTRRCCSACAPTCASGCGACSSCANARRRARATTSSRSCAGHLQPRVLQQLRRDTGIQYDQRTQGILHFYTRPKSSTPR